MAQKTRHGRCVGHVDLLQGLPISTAKAVQEAAVLD
jgi:hypothetical protein